MSELEPAVNPEETVSTGKETKTLPSMPLLYPPSQPGSPVSKSENSECDHLPASSENELEMMCSPEKQLTLSPTKDSWNDVDYISMEECDESPRVSHDKRKPLQCSNPAHPPVKKRRKQDIVELTEGMDEEPGNHYAEAYFTKVKSMLDEAMFQKFVTILSEAKDEPGGAVKLYKKIEELFVDYPELAEDFVGTLRPDQALEIGKLLELKFITRSMAFFKKLEGFQLTKVIHALETLASNSQLNEELVKSTILSILKGHGHLAESFLHLLPNEKPPPPSSLDDYEDITEAMLEEGDDSGWENTRIPEHAERGCLMDCPCRCHSTPSQPFCLACNIRFIKGQAYVQYGKVIRYCKVHFGDMSHDEVLQRFNPALYSKRRRKRKSISKTVNPPCESSKETKEVIFQDENAIISKEDVQCSNSSCMMEDKVEEDDDYWEEDDVSSGDKSSGGDMYEESDRHSEDTEDRFIGQVNNPLSPLASTVEGFYSRNGQPDAVREGVVIDVSDIRPNGVNAHVIKFETRPSDDPCIKSPTTPERTLDAPPPSQDAIEKCDIHRETNDDLPALVASVPDDASEDLKDFLVKTECISEENSQEEVFTAADDLKCSVDGIVKVEAADETEDIPQSENPATVSSVAEIPDPKPQCPAEAEVDAMAQPDEPNDEITDKTKDPEKEWTRHEDKMILEAFQREIGTEETFARIRNLMPARSVDQIQERFQVLMNLLEKVASASHEPQPT